MKSLIGGVLLPLTCVWPLVAALGEPGDGPASALDTLHLKEVLRDVITHNDQATAARFMAEAAQSKIGLAGAWDDPTIMLGVANLPTSLRFNEDMMTMKMVGLSQKIPYAGEKGLSLKAARAEADAAHEDRRETILNLVSAAKSAYADVLYRQLTLGDLRQQHDLSTDIVRSVRGRLAANQANQEDVSAAEADLWRLESEILSGEQELDAAWNALCALRGIDPLAPVPALFEPTEFSIPDDVASWLAAAQANYPPLRRLRYRAAGYGYSAAAARRMRWPMLELSANYGFRGQVGMERPSDMIGFQAMLSVPIFAGRRQGNMAQSMTAMEKGTAAEADQLWRDTDAALRTLHQRAVRLRQSLTLYRERIIPADEDAYRSALAGYQANRTSFTTLLAYAAAIIRDHITANMIANDLARTLAEVERYTLNADKLIAAQAPETTEAEKR